MGKGGSKLKRNIIIVGLDGSGKSTIINFFKPKKQSVLEVVPTVGYQVEGFTKKKIQFTVFDMSGDGRYRSIWERYYSEAQAIIFVIDSTDMTRFAIAKNELELLLKHKDIQIKSIPILFYANKMDLPEAKNPVEIMKAMQLDQVVNKS